MKRVDDVIRSTIPMAGFVLTAWLAGSALLKYANYSVSGGYNSWGIEVGLQLVLCVIAGSLTAFAGRGYARAVMVLMFSLAFLLGFAIFEISSGRSQAAGIPPPAFTTSLLDSIAFLIPPLLGLTVAWIVYLIKSQETASS